MMEAIDKASPAFLALSLALAASRAETQPLGEDVPLLTLAEAVETALANNERVIEARDNLQQAKLSVHLAESFFSPKIVPNVLGSFGQTNQANQTYQLTVSKRFGTGAEVRANMATTSLRNQLGNFWNTDTAFSVRQPILRGFGGTVTGRQLASSQVAVRTAEHRQVLMDRELLVQVAAAYYRIVSQSRLAEVAGKSRARAQELLAASEAKLQAGRVSQLDVYRAEELAAETEGQSLDAEAALEDARDFLRDLLELDHDYQFRVDMEIPRPVESVSPEDAAVLAMENSLELRVARDAIEDAERGVAFAKNQLQPQLDVGVAALRGQTSESVTETFGVDGYEVATFVAASAPIDRTSEIIAYNNALIDRDRRRRELTRIERRITSETRRVVREQERLFRSLDLAESKVRFAGSELEVATLRYQRGLANNLDVVNAELNLLSAESSRIATLADLAVARLQVRSALGVLDPRKEF